MSRTSKHIFALYDPSIDHHVVNGTLMVRDTNTVKRMTNVLRLAVGDTVIIFGTRFAAECHIRAHDKKHVELYVTERWSIAPLWPAMYWYVPIADKAAFEDAVSYLTVMGIHTIYPIITEKSKRSWGTQKDFDRIWRVMIAAAEQSKQFAIPEITRAYALAEIPYIADYTFVCDPAGQPLHSYLSTFTDVSRSVSYAGIVGPEGGLTDEEVSYLDRLGCYRLRLGPSILRMETAVAVASGAMRALLPE